ncbi:MAG: hypothetical protein IJZ04_07805 [Clostridia bacterium]|nr:hypothetical protein [Clostridia bacterium]
MITLKQRAEIAVLLLGELCPPELQVALGCGYEACKRLICELEEKGRLSHLKGDTYRAGKANNELERRIGHNRGTLDPDSAREAIEAITEKKAENGRVRERIRIRSRDDDDDDTGYKGSVYDTRAYQSMDFGKLERPPMFKNLSEELSDKEQSDKKEGEGKNGTDPYAGMSLAERFEALRKKYKMIEDSDTSSDDDTDDTDDTEDTDSASGDSSDDDDDFDWLDDDDDDTEDDDTEDNSSDTDSDNDRGIEGLEAFITRRRRLADRNFERRRLCTREGANTAEGMLGNRIAEALFDSFTVLYSNEMYNINDTQTYNPVAFMVNECSRWYYSDKGHTISHLMKTLDVTTDRVSNAIAKVVEMYDCRMVAGEILTKKEIDPDTAVKQLIEFLAMIEHLKRLKVSEMYLLVSLDMQEQIRDTFKRLVIENAECNRTQLIERVDEAIRALTAEGSYDRVECFCYEAIRDHLDGSTDDEFLFFKASLLNI